MLQTLVRFEVNFAQLGKDIVIYTERHPKKEKPEFLVMNTTTAQILANDGIYITNYQTDILASELYGIRVAVNNSLDDYIVKVVG